MFYEPYNGKKQKQYAGPKRRSGCLGMLLKFVFGLLWRVLILGLVLAVIAYILPPALFQLEPEQDLGLTPGLPGSHTNILFLGVDKLSDNAQRSDTMIICSIGYNDLKLTSILRDTEVEIPGYGKGRINAAFAHGGAELAMETVNRNFGMNISKYAVVDFTTLIYLIDALGGVDVVVSQAEMEQVNHNNRKLIGNTGLKDVLGYVPGTLTTYSVNEETVHLDGTQGLAYARIRRIDSDFTRASRQREVIGAMKTAFIKNAWNPLTYVRFVQAFQKGVDTNMSVVEMISLGLKAVVASDMRQLRLPAEGAYTDTGSRIRIDRPDLNMQALYSFIYDS